ncbi:uncharacterized protein BYT42DRAFT_610090 [Radiomyces spectabilis]|uniref:uncharacterized protein n=1 Tax=Radiomyces spectabilis TaxID=64574 RepID=UPI00221F145A|nr:uncharacterized protein BYT42DRAFT_610090 [Radiomyces spectabilis]KAI8390813.1 hypothetical protein BYT42DRAFT_610090 [Radiomyces spectabilis]
MSLRCQTAHSRFIPPRDRLRQTPFVPEPSGDYYNIKGAINELQRDSTMNMLIQREYETRYRFSQQLRQQDVLENVLRLLRIGVRNQNRSHLNKGKPYDNYLLIGSSDTLCRNRNVTHMVGSPVPPVGKNNHLRLSRSDIDMLNVFGDRGIVEARSKTE